MYSILFLAVTSFICCLILTPLIRKWSCRQGLVDQPDGGRKLQIEFFDPGPQLREQIGSNLDQYRIPNDGHPTEAGADLIANAVWAVAGAAPARLTLGSSRAIYRL